jgi:hypothetical protein
MYLDINLGIFLCISLNAVCFCILRLKVEDATEKFKNHQRFFSLYDPSNYTTSSQTQTGETVPLNKHVSGLIQYIGVQNTPCLLILETIV